MDGHEAEKYTQNWQAIDCNFLRSKSGSFPSNSKEPLTADLQALVTKEICLRAAFDILDSCIPSGTPEVCSLVDVHIQSNTPAIATWIFELRLL